MSRARASEDKPSKTLPPEPEVEAKGHGAADTPLPWEDQAATDTATKNAPTETGDIFANLDNLRLKQDFTRAKSESRSPFAPCANHGGTSGSKRTGTRPSGLIRGCSRSRKG
jgi:hypothetical protein